MDGKCSIHSCIHTYIHASYSQAKNSEVEERCKRLRSRQKEKDDRRRKAIEFQEELEQSRARDAEAQFEEADRIRDSEPEQSTNGGAQGGQTSMSVTDLEQSRARDEEAQFEEANRIRDSETEQRIRDAETEQNTDGGAQGGQTSMSATEVGREANSSRDAESEWNSRIGDAESEQVAHREEQGIGASFADNRGVHDSETENDMNVGAQTNASAEGVRVVDGDVHVDATVDVHVDATQRPRHAGWNEHGGTTSISDGDDHVGDGNGCVDATQRLNRADVNEASGGEHVSTSGGHTMHARASGFDVKEKACGARGGEVEIAPAHVAVIEDSSAANNWAAEDAQAHDDLQQPSLSPATRRNSHDADGGRRGEHTEHIHRPEHAAQCDIHSGIHEHDEDRLRCQEVVHGHVDTRQDDRSAMSQHLRPKDAAHHHAHTDNHDEHRSHGDDLHAAAARAHTEHDASTTIRQLLDETRQQDQSGVIQEQTPMDRDRELDYLEHVEICSVSDEESDAETTRGRLWPSTWRMAENDNGLKSESDGCE
jgi:hypothetical protein